MALRSVGIIGTGSYLPKKILTNFDLEKMVATSDGWIRTRTGIRERRIAEDKEVTSDLASQAALKALESARMDPDEVELIIVATATPDMLFPSTACFVQEKIKARRAAAFDVSAACTGFVYGLAVGEQFIKAGGCRKVLVIGAETFSRIVDWKDRSTCVLFGDGAGAVVLQGIMEDRGILSTYLASDGSAAELLMVPGGGSRHPPTYQTVKERLHYVKMSGNEVFKLAVTAIGAASKEVLSRCKLTYKDVDIFIPHQANIRIIEAAAKRLKLGMDKVYINLDRYGNTSAASIGIALDEAVREGRIKAGDIVLLVAFGGGFTWGAAVIKW